MKRRWLGPVLLCIFCVTAAGVVAIRLRSRATPDEMFATGMAALERSDWPAALRAADQLRRHPDHADQEQLLRGLHALKNNHPKTALQELDLITNPKGALREPALLAAGEALYHLGRLAEADRLFLTVASEHPGHLDSHRWLAAIAYDLSDMTRALDELGIVSRLTPTDHRPYILKGQIHADFEQYREAIEAYSQAVQRHPPEDVLAEMLPRLARCQMQTRDYAGALKTLSQASPSAKALSLEAECHLSLGNEAQAQARLAEARKLDPTDLEALRLFGRMELDAGRPQAALEPLRAVVKRDPQDHESRHHLAQALRLTGQIPAAEAEARASARLVSLKLDMAKLNVEAIEHPQDDKVRDRLAAVCEELGKPQLAASWRTAATACRQRAREIKATPSKKGVETIP